MKAGFTWLIAAVVRLLLLPAAFAGVQAAAEPVASVEVVPRVAATVDLARCELAAPGKGEAATCMHC